jgi:hypothetical protein
MYWLDVTGREAGARGVGKRRNCLLSESTTVNCSVCENSDPKQMILSLHRFIAIRRRSA